MLENVATGAIISMGHHEHNKPTLWPCIALSEMGGHTNKMYERMKV